MGLNLIICAFWLLNQFFSVRGLFRFSSSWVSLSSLSLTRNLPILSYLIHWHRVVHDNSHSSLYFSKTGSFVHSFVPFFTNLNLLSFYLVGLESLLILSFPKSQRLISLIVSIVFLFFISLVSWNYYFFLIACLEFSLLSYTHSFHPVYKSRMLSYWFEIFLPYKVGTYMDKFPSKHCFICISYVLVCNIFIFIHLKAFLWISFLIFFLDLLVI